MYYCQYLTRLQQPLTCAKLYLVPLLSGVEQCAHLCIENVGLLINPFQNLGKEDEQDRNNTWFQDLSFSSLLKDLCNLCMWVKYLKPHSSKSLSHSFCRSDLQGGKSLNNLCICKNVSKILQFPLSEIQMKASKSKMLESKTEF